MKASTLTKHAKQRLDQRTKLTPEMFNVILRDKAYLNLGNKPGMTREHLLFYSSVDSECFVAIRDSINGDIVTILTKEYHENLAWDITDEDCFMAKRQVLYCAKEKDHKTRTLHISVSYLNTENQRKTKKIHGIQDFKGNAALYLKETLDINQIIQAAREKGVTGELTGVIAKLGKSGPLEFKDIDWINVRNRPAITGC